MKDLIWLSVTWWPGTLLSSAREFLQGPTRPAADAIRGAGGPKSIPSGGRQFQSVYALLAFTAAEPTPSRQSAILIFAPHPSVIGAAVGVRIPRGARDHRYGCACLFSAACPATGDAVGRMCGKINTREMGRHLRDIGGWVPEGRHALLVLDGTGWQRPKDLEIPSNVSPLRLPPCSPEPSPMERLFSVPGHRHFANREFQSADHGRTVVEEVWDGFVRRKDETARITAREWAVP